MVYTVLESKREEVEKKLARCAKKAEKYGATLNVALSAPYMKHVKHYDTELGVSILTWEGDFEVFDLTIDGEAFKRGNYDVLARIEHLDGGNIVNVFNGELKPVYATLKPFCEHCNSNHGLRYTFMVSNCAETRQVGRTCLKDYCGIDPQLIGIYNAFSEDIEEIDVEHCDLRGIPQAIDLETILALAVDVQNKQGYVKSSEAGSNKSIVWERWEKNVLPTEAGKVEASKILTTLKNMTVEEAVEWRLNNVKTFANGGYCRAQDVGFIACTPMMFRRMEEKQARNAEREKQAEALRNASHYVGTIGERLTLNVSKFDLVTTFETQFGTTTLYRFIDDGGNVLVWFASSPLGSWDNGRWMPTETVKTIKATVKAHNERDGVKQTVLTRVKVA